MPDMPYGLSQRSPVTGLAAICSMGLSALQTVITGTPINAVTRVGRTDEQKNPGRGPRVSRGRLLDHPPLAGFQAPRHQVEAVRDAAPRDHPARSLVCADEEQHRPDDGHDL